MVVAGSKVGDSLVVTGAAVPDALSAVARKVNPSLFSGSMERTACAHWRTLSQSNWESADSASSSSLSICRWKRSLAMIDLYPERNDDGVIVTAGKFESRL